MLQLSVRTDLTLEGFRRVAWEGEGVRFDPEALARMAECRAAFLRLIDADPPPVIYGVTTGYGQDASRKLGPEERRRQAARPLLSTVVAVGPSLPQRVARGIVFARLANYVEGHAAISPALAEAVAALLDGPDLPTVGLSGQGGAGEILGLGPLFADLAARFDLGEKESLALINGSPCASALVADAALAMRRRLALAEQVFALSAEAIRAPLEAYAPEFETLWADPFEAAALQSLRAALAGGGKDRRPYQAPVSYRILPRVLGQARRALAAAEEVAAVSLRSVTDNPVFLPPDAEHPQGRVYSNGGYHNAKASPALDDLAAAAADLCLLADRHTAKLLDGRVSLLPDQLRVAGGDGYLGGLAMAQVGYLEEARRAAQRSFLPGSESGGFGQNDVAPPTFFAWRGQERAGWCLDAALATLSAVASQALFVTDRGAPPALADLLGEIRERFPPVTAIRSLAAEVERLLVAFRARIYDGRVCAADAERWSS